MGVPVLDSRTFVHHTHQPCTFERWAAAVPAGFRFSAKLPRAITHDARLRGTGDALSAFLDSVACLGPKLGGLLVQLPPSLVFDARTASTFLAMLRRRTTVPVACEPRHPSWFAPGVEAVWMRYSVTRVAADPARVPAAAEAGGAAVHWRYWRWHGSPRIYYSGYSAEALARLAGHLRHAGRRVAPAWCILDNTAGGHAVADAARLQVLVDGAVPSPP